MLDRNDTTHTNFKISCATTQFTAFPFCVTNFKTHVVWGLSKHYHLCLDPELGHEKCAKRHISCACVKCINMLDTPCPPGVSHVQQTRYQTLVYCTYRTVLFTLNKQKIIQFTNKNTHCEDFNEIHKVVLDGTNENM